MMINIAEKVPCDLKDCISRHIFLVGAGSEPWGRPMTNLCQALKQYTVRAYAKIRLARSGKSGDGGKKMGKAIDNIDLNQMSHRYVSGVFQND